jgi:Dyp-type peroxidase family
VTTPLELSDLQGNILTAYGRLGFPKARYLLLHVGEASAGRAFVDRLRHRVTTALRWPSLRESEHPAKRAAKNAGLNLAANADGNPVTRPPVAINIAFTFRGLLALGLPTRTLRSMPDDFVDGMLARAAILGDDVLDNTPEHWDRVWQADRPSVHILVTLNAQLGRDGQAVPELAAATDKILRLAASFDTVAPGALTLLDGHRGPATRWQELSALMADGQPVPSEHFGFIDAIGDPVFAGQYPDGAAASVAGGQGAVDGHGNWRPLATGEFLLGWNDEAQEVAGAPLPMGFSRNGSFFSYRKLHQHVNAFDEWLTRTSQRFAVAWSFGNLDDARDTLMAKMAGRWHDGVPLIAAPDVAAWRRFNEIFPPASTERGRELVEFRYGGDPQGIRCPITSHMRRMNTRDGLDPRANAEANERMGSALNNRRRILRRGLPYGARDATDGEHGIVMLSHCASLSRQFEFVQQQWVNFGLDFNAGNDSCPLVGNHPDGARFVIAADPASGHSPFIAGALPQFVSTRGGDYFFAPSMTALHMIGVGLIDPT